MSTNETKNNKNLVVPSIIFGFVLFSIGFLIGNTEEIGAAQTGRPDMSEFWEVWDLIDQKYPDGATYTTEERLWGAIEGLVAGSGDPYSSFYPPEESNDFEELIEGTFSGIGAEIDKVNGALTVISPLKESPAEKAGLKAGDRILEIEGQSTAMMSVEDAIDKIRGKKGTEVTLTINPKDTFEFYEVKIKRDTINIPTIKTEVRDGDIFIISLYNFNARSAGEFEREIKVFAKNQNYKNLILDLRGNPGGYLDSAVSIASYFVPKGEVVVSEKYGPENEEKAYRSKGYTDLSGKDFDMVVLVDGGSASASEILAGVLKDYKIATIIGMTTFGKGSVQELIPVSADTSVKLTVAKWYTPNGTSFSEAGLDPDVVSEYDSKAEIDSQIEAAVEFLKNN